MGPALKALECNVHVRVPESQQSGTTFPYCTSLESLGGEDAELDAADPTREGITSLTSHTKHPIVGTGSVLNSLQLLLEAQDEFRPIFHGRNVELLAFIQDLVHWADLTSSA